MKKYKSYWDFLKSTPKNLSSIMVIWGMSLLCLFTMYGEEFDPEWTKHFANGFIVCVMVLGLYRPYTIYKKFK